MVGEVLVPQLAADHQLGDAVLVDLGELALGHQLAIPEHIVAVADLKQLGHLVGDVDKADPLLPQLAHDGEEVLNLMGGQGGGGLIHDDELRLEEQGLGDLHQLHLSGVELAHLGLQVDVHPHALQHLGALGLHLVLFQQAKAANLIAQVHVLKHLQVAAQVQLLVDEADPVPVGHLGVVHDHLLPVQEDLPGGGLVAARQHIHQGGLAGPVLPQQAQHRPRLYGDGHVVHRPGGPELHHNVFHFHKHATASFLTDPPWGGRQDTSEKQGSALSSQTRPDRKGPAGICRPALLSSCRAVAR